MLVREEKFALSKRLYAINRNVFTVEQRLGSDGVTPSYSYALQAVWFRKRSNGRLAVFRGVLWDHSYGGTAWTVEDFIEKCDTARYGGRPDGCWDGEETWNIPNLREQLQFVKEVDPYLVNYPELPAGYDGWYKMVD